MPTSNRKSEAYCDQRIPSDTFTGSLLTVYKNHCGIAVKLHLKYWLYELYGGQILHEIRQAKSDLATLLFIGLICGQHYVKMERFEWNVIRHGSSNL